MAFLPVSKEEMLERGWDRPDFVYICGDAYVDHPSFGAAIICRVLESQDIRCVLLHSLIGRQRKISHVLENPDWLFW